MLTPEATPPPPTPPSPVDIIEETERAAVLLSPVRLCLLEALGEGDSAVGVARRLSLPRQKVNYHLRELERAGLAELVEERRKGNCTERILRATAVSYVIAPQALGALEPDPRRLRDRFSFAYLVSVAARAIRELAVLRRRADRAGKKLATLTLETEVRFADPRAQREFARELAEAVAGIAAKYHSQGVAGGRTFRVLAGAYPALAAGDGGGAAEAREEGSSVH